MKTKKKYPLCLLPCTLCLIFTFHFSLFTFNSFSQGAAINTTGAAANSSAMLDVSATNQGVLIPRVSLTSVTSASPVTSPANKLIVYNTNASIDQGNGVGIYIYDSTGTTTGKWIYLAAPSNGPGTSGQVLTSSGSGAPTWTTPSGGQIIYDAIVATSGGDYTTLGAAITAGAISIYVKDGTYTETGNITLPVNCVIVGESIEGTVVNLSIYQIIASGSESSVKNLKLIKTGSGPVFSISANSSFSDLIVDVSSSTNGTICFSSSTDGLKIFLNNIDMRLANTTNSSGFYFNCDSFIEADNIKITTGGILNKGYTIFFRGGVVNNVYITGDFGSDCNIIYIGGNSDSKPQLNNVIIKLSNTVSSNSYIRVDPIASINNFIWLNTNVTLYLQLRGSVEVSNVYIAKGGIYLDGDKNNISNFTIDQLINNLGTNNSFSNGRIINASSVTRDKTNLTNVNFDAGITISANNCNISNCQFGGNLLINGNYNTITASNIVGTTTDNGIGNKLRYNMGAAAPEEKETMKMKNASGTVLVAGNVVVLNSVAAGNEITTTTTKGDSKVLGMVVDAIAGAATGYIQVLGKTTLLKVNGTTPIAIGDFLTTYTTAGIACKAGAGDMAFAIALEAYATAGDGGVIDALLITPRTIPTAAGAVISGIDNYLARFNAAGNNVENSGIVDNSDAVAVTIDANENVGIGTTTPSTCLEIAGGAGNANGLNLAVDPATSTYSQRLFFSNNTAGQSATMLNDGGNLRFFTGGTPGSSSGTHQMTLTSAGNLGIGTTTPASKLTINNTASFSSEYTIGTTSGAIAIDLANGNKQTITLTGNVTSVTFSNLTIANFVIKVKQPASGGPYTVSGWGANVKWSGGATPTFSTTANAEDIITCYCNGTNIYCQAAMDFK
ncbi:MAG: hypothetical protein HGB12_02850 [Bacteroidetes bacterium]|nr:hypothetical protein [Bacteroidota bacterium]